MRQTYRVFQEHNDGARPGFIMPWVVIKTGLKTPDGNEEELREYICDFSGCSNVATHVIGCVVELGQVVKVCAEHIPKRHH